MKSLIFCAALALLIPITPVWAQDFSLQILVVDKDVHGTNIRDTPGGKIIDVMPYSAMRLVSISDSQKGWFKVQADGHAGWMHNSVLGLCVSAAEDKDPDLNKKPDDMSPSLVRIPDDAPVQPLALQGHWLKVKYVDAKGKTYEGWLPEQVTRSSENGLKECAATWAARK